MRRIAARFHDLFVPATPAGAFASGTANPHEGIFHARRASLRPLRQANDGLAHRDGPDPDPASGPLLPDDEMWPWQHAEGVDKPLAYSR